MPKLNSLPVIYGLDPMDSSTTQEHQLGAIGFDGDGRKFRYAKAGTTALVAGTLLQAPAEIGNHQNLTPSAASAGATTVTVTLGATAVTANQYAEGYLVVTATAGNGLYYRIKSHPAAALSSSLTLTLEDAVQVAITTSSKIDLVSNPYNGVIINPYAAATSAPVGVAMFAVPASNYCWIQTGGLGTVIADADADITVGATVCASNATDGCCENATGTQARVGIAATAITSGQSGACHLFLD